MRPDNCRDTHPREFLQGYHPVPVFHLSRVGHYFADPRFPIAMKD